MTNPTINKKITTINCTRGNNKKQFIVIHDVGVKGQTALNNINYFNNGYRGASAHYFVDRTSIWQLVEDNDIAWHVGDDKNDSDDGINNYNSIGIEMIVEKDGTIHSETKENTKWLVKHLQNKYKISNKSIVRHFDASGKNCPQYLNKDKKWTDWYVFYKYLTSEGDELTVSQYNEIKQLIDAQAKEIKELKEQLNNKETSPSAWAKEFYDWAVNEGLTDGSVPKGYLSREQSFILLKKFYDKYIK